MGKDLAQYAMQKYGIFVIDEDDYSVAAANELRDLLFSCPVRALTRLVDTTFTWGMGIDLGMVRYGNFFGSLPLLVYRYVYMIKFLRVVTFDNRVESFDKKKHDDERYKLHPCQTETEGHIIKLSTALHERFQTRLDA